MDDQEFGTYFESRPAWLQSNETERENPRAVVFISGKPFPYTVCRREMQPSIQYFVGYAEKQHLFISDEVPEADREYYLAHEVREFTAPDLKDRPGRCLKSLRQELKDLTDEIKASGYIARRTRMYEDLFRYFDDLVEQLKGTDPGKTKNFSEIKDEIQQSLEYLRSLDSPSV